MGCLGLNPKARTGSWLAYAVAAMTLWVGQVVAYSDLDTMICYKPPPPAPPNRLPANDPAMHPELFSFRTEFEAENLPDVRDTFHNISVMGISTTCGVEFHVVYNITLYVRRDVTLDCEYIDKASPPQTPLPSYGIQVLSFDQSSRVSTVCGYFAVDRVFAADGVLQLNCRVTLAEEISGIINSLFVQIKVTIELLGCPHWTFGAKCNRTCVCAQGVECHPFYGDCVCPQGLQGKMCERAKPFLARPGPDSIFVPFGRSVTLTCIGYGMSLSHGSWEHKGTKLDTQTGAEAVPYSPRPFYVRTTIVAATADANGVYRCTVMDANQNNKAHTATVEVIVTYIPQPFLETPSNQTVTLGSRAELHCRTKPEAGLQTWAVESGNQTLGNAKEVLAEVEEQGGNQTNPVLTLPNARFEDVGMYQCIVGHPGANDSAVATAWLTVESPGRTPSISVLHGADDNSSLPVIRTIEGALLTLSCQVLEAYPAPSIAWYIGGLDRTAESTTSTRTSPNGISYDANSTLTLRPSWHDNGKHVACVIMVTDFPSVQSEELQLDVLYVPKVSVTPSESTVRPGSSPKFSCQVNANPSPQDKDYRWTLRRSNGKIIQYYIGRRSVCIEHAKPDLNMATLTCNVSNDLGWNSSKAIMKVFKDVDHLGGLSMAVMVTVLVILAALTVTVPVLVFQHRGRLHDHFFRHRTRPDLKGKEHDVFVAYKGGGEEEVFVNSQLLPKLADWGCVVCIDYQNFLPGREIVDNIMGAVASSRKTLLVLSPDFMASEWCYFEFMCAVAEGLQRQTDSAVPLMFREIRDGELCASMRTLLDTVSFIPWPEERPHATAPTTATTEFWKLLHRAMDTEYNVNRIREENGDVINNNNNADGNANDHIALV